MKQKNTPQARTCKVFWWAFACCMLLWFLPLLVARGQAPTTQTLPDAAALNGRLRLLEGDTKRLLIEQQLLRQSLEQNQNESAKLKRQLAEALDNLKTTTTTLIEEQDKLESLQQEIVRLLRSPVGDLPAKSAGDKAFRTAFLYMVSGELDLAAQAFAEFYQTRPHHPKAQEALLREGQAWFLLRRHARALKPLLSVTERYQEGPWALQGRWMLARSLEETGEWQLARALYAQLAEGRTFYALDSAKRLAFLQKRTQTEP